MNNTTQSATVKLDSLGNLGGIYEIGQYTYAGVSIYPNGQSWTTGGGASVEVEFQGTIDGRSWTTIATLNTVSMQSLELPIVQYSQARFIVSGVEAGKQAVCTMYAYDLQTPTHP